MFLLIFVEAFGDIFGHKLPTFVKKHPTIFLQGEEKLTHTNPYNPAMYGIFTHMDD